LVVLDILAVSLDPGIDIDVSPIYRVMDFRLRGNDGGFLVAFKEIDSVAE
jgi:hypothetical protein